MRLSVERKVSANYPHIIEMAGVAGAGKSTLRNALMQCNARVQTLPPPSKLSYVPCLIRIFFAWLPLYVTHYPGTKWFTLQQIRNIGYLDTWLSTIRSHGRTGEDIVIIDPGSVFWLSDLQEFGPALTKHPRFQAWWNAKLKQWASAMDAVLWLDAPEELCIERVHTRDEEHQLKQASVEMGLKELKCYRESYQKIIPIMASENLKVLHFRSDQMSTQQMLAKILSDEQLKSILTPSHDPIH